MTGDTSCHFAVINYIITYPPLYFVRSGWISLIIGRLRAAGNGGFGWPSSAVAYTSVTSATAYYLGFYTTNVGPSDGPYHRWNGFPLRCLVPLKFSKI